MNFADLRNADYGKGFIMPTMSELAQLICGSLENQKYHSAKNVVKTLKSKLLYGNTGIFYAPEGMYIQDNPNIKNGRVSMDQKMLERKLGKNEEKGVVFSNDRTIRFTPYNFNTGLQSPLQLAKNTGVMALVGGEENAEKIAKASDNYKVKINFWASKPTDAPETKVAGLGSYCFNEVGVSARCDENYEAGSYSFGAKETK